MSSPGLVGACSVSVRGAPVAEPLVQRVLDAEIEVGVLARQFCESAVRADGGQVSGIGTISASNMLAN